ncbi:hypothetical protein MRX96_055857 [Rhipicephalus microplus]
MGIHCTDNADSCASRNEPDVVVTMASTSGSAGRMLRLASQLARPMVAGGNVKPAAVVSAHCCWPAAPGAIVQRGFSSAPLCCQMQTTELYREDAIPLQKAEQKTAVIHEGPYKERRVTVHTCAELFREWKHTRPGYKHVNEDGISVPLTYIHTGLDRQAAAGEPVVFALHGAPGTYREFDSLVPVLDAQGASVIVPTLPVAPCIPMLHLALRDPEINIKSLVFIAPSGCRRITQLSPYWMMKSFDEWFRVPWLQEFMCWLAVYIVRLLGKPNNNQMKGTILSMITVRNSKYDEAGPMVCELKRRGVPMLMFYGERDKLIDSAVSEEMAAMLGVQLDSVHVYNGRDDKTAVLLQSGKPDGNCEVVCFKQGTHFAFKKYPNIFNDFILQFWNRNERTCT